jgi:hypothetical protein
MKISDIKTVKVDWMKGYGNDPHLKFILKRDRKLTPWEQFRFVQHGRLFFAEYENEVRFVAHDPGNHSGFGGSAFVLRMADSWDECQWVSGCKPCKYDPQTRTVTLCGPWSSNATAMSRAFCPVASADTLEGPSRLTVSSPRYYRQMQKIGRSWDGTYSATHYTLDFVREVIDVHAPHLELYEGDYGWYPVRKGEAPKNPRRNTAARDSFLSGEQMAVVFA